MSLLNMHGKTAFVTGSTDGAGRYVALKLAQSGATVLVHGRDLDRGKQLLKTIRDAGYPQAFFYPADFSSLAEVRRLAATVLREHGSLDVLINNAGIGIGPDGEARQVSQDGYELRFAVNYLSGFLLTRLLLDRLAETGNARIVHVTSIGQQALDFDNVMLERGYSGTRAYCQSKLAQVMFTLDLAEELAPRGMTANCLHPATYMDTTMVRQSGVAPVSSVQEGGDAIFALAANPAWKNTSGTYFDGQRLSRPNRQAFEPEARERLRLMSYRLVGL